MPSLRLETNRFRSKFAVLDRPCGWSVVATVRFVSEKVERKNSVDPGLANRALKNRGQVSMVSLSKQDRERTGESQKRVRTSSLTVKNHGWGVGGVFFFLPVKRTLILSSPGGKGAS